MRPLIRFVFLQIFMKLRSYICTYIASASEKQKGKSNRNKLFIGLMNNEQETITTTTCTGFRKNKL